MTRGNPSRTRGDQIDALRFSTGAQSEVILGEIVTGNYFDVLGVPAIKGRTFSPDEDKAPGAAPVVVVSHRFRGRRFDSDPDLVGKTMTLNGQVFTIVGIGLESFTVDGDVQNRRAGADDDAGPAHPNPPHRLRCGLIGAVRARLLGSRPSR